MVQRTKNQNSLVVGEWLTICDRCGFKFKSCDLKKEWTGFYVCKDCYEPRHPQDFVKSVPDNTSVPWSRPDSNADSSYTDVGGTAHTTDNKVDTYGDESPTITWGTGNTVIEFNTDLTANRTATIAGSPSDHDRYTFYRTGGGAFTLDVGGVKTIPASVTAVVVIEYLNSAWREISYTPLGL